MNALMRWMLAVLAALLAGHASAQVTFYEHENFEGRSFTALKRLDDFHRAGFNDDETIGFLARLLFAEGREIEAEKVLNNNKAAFKKIQSGWLTAEQQPMNAAV